MKRLFLPKLGLAAAALLGGLLICELVARLLTTADADGQAYLRGQPLLPYHPPLKHIRSVVDSYLGNLNQAYLRADPVTGWSIAPNARGGSGLYQSNSSGIRSEPREYKPTPPAGKIRIALFGDSFTHGDELPYDKTWGRLLENYLLGAGVNAEVINFGVPAYGIDQSYLRWQQLGRSFHPDVVILGFQVENLKRTVNVFRPLYSPGSGLPFTKPRFFLKATGELALTNSPALPPEEIASAIDDLNRSPLAPYEYWHNPKNYSASIWDKSRLFRLLRTLFAKKTLDRQEGPGWLDAGGEAVRVTLAVIRQFAREAQQDGAIFVFLHTPAKSQIKNLREGEETPFAFFFRELEKNGIPVVDPSEAMQGKSGLYKRQSHFSERGGEIVGRLLKERLLNLLP